MQKTGCSLTVFFEDPFWIGVLERETDGKLTVCKITFGAEPKDYEVYQYLLEHWHTFRFSPPVRADGNRPALINPKRMHRVIQKQLDACGVSTKSQQALKLQYDETKAERKVKTRAEKEAEEERLFAIRRRKRKQRHKGR